MDGRIFFCFTLIENGWRANFQRKMLFDRTSENSARSDTYKLISVTLRTLIVHDNNSEMLFVNLQKINTQSACVLQLFFPGQSIH